MRVLVTGAAGQLGRDLLNAFARHEVTGLGHADLDIGNEAAVADAVAAVRPSVVVNAAAMTDVDGCESDRGRAHRVNALGPWWLARACAREGATLVQVSTDYVFSGAPPVGPGGEPRGWTEFDPVAPGNTYGHSKAAAEQLVRETLDRHHIVRTAWLAGAGGTNFVRTMLGLGADGHVRVVEDQVGSWTATEDLARAIVEIATSGRHGTVHRVNRGRASWADVADAVFAAADMDVQVERVSSAAFPRPAARPEWSVLDQGHADAMGLTPLPDWTASLERLVRQLLELGA
ncbi:MAG: dTDP-4-dehydrorhamnose reductase [Nitriliruptorales bacterium]|nr:dTDP-4-dehydrorhamnose reductase [Nitriliruptorales bacterium]